MTAEVRDQRHCACGCGANLPTDAPRSRKYLTRAHRRGYKREQDRKHHARPGRLLFGVELTKPREQAFCKCGCGHELPAMRSYHTLYATGHARFNKKSKARYKEEPVAQPLPAPTLEVNEIDWEDVPL